jgi:hypothetical protein
MRELDGEQARQSINTRQVFEAYEAAASERRRRFVGSMRWARRRGNDYLLRKIGAKETSLGPRGEETERAFAAFSEGRDKNRELLRGLAARLDRMAPVNRAMGLARMPVIAARIIRRCNESDLIGRQLFVVGTNALYAYEAKAGVHIESGLLATGDIDLLYDSRRRLSLAVAGDLRSTGFIGLLQQVDKSFAPLSPWRVSGNKQGRLSGGPDQTTGEGHTPGTGALGLERRRRGSGRGSDHRSSLARQRSEVRCRRH